MHMADALVSPAVGGAMWAATAGLVAYSARKVQNDLEESKIPLMGVLGAFIFAAQMVNFAIPGTGSSGHLAGGLILAVILGPQAAFLTMASILTVQALFFGDGGLLALGCNIINMGFYACFVAYPLLYKPLAGKKTSPGRIFAGAMLAAVVALQLGSLSVVAETLFSSISALPWRTFILLMQPIHLAIGIVEGLITTAVIGFVATARPELLADASERIAGGRVSGKIALKPVLIGFAVAALLTGGIISWFASQSPDGLEWSVFHATGRQTLTAADPLHHIIARIQEKIVLFPDYTLKKRASDKSGQTATPPSVARSGAVRSGTTIAGLIGGFFVLLLAGLIGLGLWFVKKKQSRREQRRGRA